MSEDNNTPNSSGNSNKNNSNKNSDDSIMSSAEIEKKNSKPTTVSENAVAPKDPEKNKAIKTPKEKGPIRWEAVIPFAIVCALSIVYTKFFLDHHLKSAFEFVGYQVLGAEVNIDKVHTSLLKGSIEIKEIQLTNAEKPTHNLIEIGDIRFGILWDGLLKAKIVVEEMAVEQIQIGTQRKSVGKVKPPEKKSNEPSFLEKEGKKLKNEALDKAQSEYQDNVLGDLAALLSGKSADGQLQNIEDSLKSKIKLKELEADLKTKSETWKQNFSKLPQQKEIEGLGQKFGKIKTKDFKSPQELQQSLQEFDALFKEVNQKVQIVNQTKDQLTADFATVDKQVKELDQLVKDDIANLEKRFKIPKIDAKTLTNALFSKYTQPILGKVTYYKGLADKYVPPNLLKKEKPDPSMVPHPRAKGVSYEFPNKSSYPLFWIKKISVSSKYSPALPAVGDLSGSINNITSNQIIVGKPTTAEIKGSFPGLNISGLNLELTADLLTPGTVFSYDFKIASMKLSKTEFVKNADLTFGLKDADSQIVSTGSLKELKNLDLKFNSGFSKLNYEVEAKDQIIKEVLTTSFNAIPQIRLDGGIRGAFPDLSVALTSNFGELFVQQIEKRVQEKIAEAKKKVQNLIDQNIGKEKEKILTDFNKFKSQYESEIKKITDQINKEKTSAESKANSAKKDTEDKAKKQAEDQIKKVLESEDNKKKLEDLKKKFGL